LTIFLPPLSSNFGLRSPVVLYLDTPAWPQILILGGTWRRARALPVVQLANVFHSDVQAPCLEIDIVLLSTANIHLIFIVRKLWTYAAALNKKDCTLDTMLRLT
jgi:hypothetical protein